MYRVWFGFATSGVYNISGRVLCRMTDYHYLSINEIVCAKKIGYVRAVKYMLNHELNIEPEKFGIQKTLNIAVELKKVHQNLKELRFRNDKATNRKIAKEAYNIIRDKYIILEKLIYSVILVKR